MSSPTNFPYFLEEVDVDQLILDPENPRLPDYVQGKSTDEIIAHMLLEESTLELMQAIGEKGFFKGEQLLVVEQESGQFKVIEGNRRLTSVMMLNDPDNAPAQLSLVKKIAENANSDLIPITTLPCMVFEKDEDIHDYLGYRHVTGIQPWNLKQRAKYVSYLRGKNYSDLTLEQASDELRKIIASKRNYVKRMLVGYDLYQIIRDNHFFKIKDLDEENFYFNYIMDSLSRSHIVEYLHVDFDNANPTETVNKDHLANWVSWLFEKIHVEGKKPKPRIRGNSEDLTKLNSVLGDKEAKVKFIEENLTLDEAYTYTEVYENILQISIEAALNELHKANGITSKVEWFYPKIEEDLREIINLSRGIKAVKDERKAHDEFDGDEFGG